MLFVFAADAADFAADAIAITMAKSARGALSACDDDITNCRRCQYVTSGAAHDAAR